MLEQTLLDQLSQHFLKLTKEVKFIYHSSSSVADFLNQIKSCSSFIEVSKVNDSPEGLLEGDSFAWVNASGIPAIVWKGLPLGHEFTSFILSVLQAGGVAFKLSAEQQQQMLQVDEPVVFETYYSQSCQNCPDVVLVLNAMAILNPLVSHHVIDGAQFTEEAEKRKVMAVPSVFKNGESWAQGRMTVNEILEKIGSKSGHDLSDKYYEVAIVGGGPAGMSAAIYLSRKGIKTGLIAKRLGGQIMDTASVENYPSVLGVHGNQLGANFEIHMRKNDLDVLSQDIVGLEKDDAMFKLKAHNGQAIRAKSVIIAPGAVWRKLGVPGEIEYANKGVAYCPHCDGPLFKGKEVMVIGGGNSGVEAAIDLAGIASKVTLVEYQGQLKADKILVDKLDSLQNVSVLFSSKIIQILGDGSKVSKAVLENTVENHRYEMNVDGIFVQIGLVPSTQWLRGSVDLNSFGEIKINEKCETSVPGLFAAGDATSIPFKQIVVAAGEGAKSAIACFDYLIRQ